jgi:hypothetical protein
LAQALIRARPLGVSCLPTLLAIVLISSPVLALRMNRRPLAVAGAGVVVPEATMTTQVPSLSLVITGLP